MVGTTNAEWAAIRATYRRDWEANNGMTWAEGQELAWHRAARRRLMLVAVARRYLRDLRAGRVTTEEIHSWVFDFVTDARRPRRCNVCGVAP